MQTILTFVRPSKEVAFFSTSVLTDRSLASDLAIFFYSHENGKASEVENKYSEDELTLVRTITWSSKEAREAFESEFKAKFPTFLEVRKAYCDENGIQFNAQEIE